MEFKKYEKINDFCDDTSVVLISSLLDNPTIDFYKWQDVLGFSKTINSMMIKVGSKYE